MCQDAGPWPGGFSTSLFTPAELSHHGTWKPSQGSGLWLITPLSVMAVRPRSAVLRGQPAPGLRGEGGEDAGPGYFFAHPCLGSDLGLVAFRSLRSSPPKKKLSECFARHCNPQTPLVLLTWVSVLTVISRVVPAAPQRLPKHPVPLFPLPPALA